MKRLSLLLVLLSTSSMAFSQNTEVTWKNPEDFRDIRPAEEIKSRYHNSLKERFSEYVAKLGEELPQGYSLKLEFTDIDLAGRVEYKFGMNRNVRMVTNSDWPKLKFNYELKSEDGVVSEGKAALKDMAFMDSPRFSGSRSDTLKYEKEMLKEWFDSDIRAKVKA